MTAEILMHIEEEMSEEQQHEFLRAFGNRAEGMHAHIHSEKPHMMFVACDPEQLCPHDLVAIAEESGIHATVIDL